MSFIRFKYSLGLHVDLSSVEESVMSVGHGGSGVHLEVFV